jgi:putative oxidoreductase
MLLSRPATTRQYDVALLIIRVVSGLTMAAHGWQKVFLMGVGNLTTGFATMGIPLAPVTAPFVSYLELIGGLMLAVGLLTRPLAFLLAVDMFGAAALVHLAGGFFLPSGAEFVLLLMSLYIALAITGGGPVSVDALLAGNKDGSRNSR